MQKLFFLNLRKLIAVTHSKPKNKANNKNTDADMSSSTNSLPLHNLFSQ